MEDHQSAIGEEAGEWKEEKTVHVLSHIFSQLSVDEVQSVRRLRRIVSASSLSSLAECLEAKVIIL